MALSVVRAARARVSVTQTTTPRRTLRVPARATFDVHGRHVEVTDDMRAAVVERLEPIVKKLEGPEFVEGAGGGASCVDVRLMNTSAEIHVKPNRLDKELHDTFARQGELTAIADGAGSAWEAFEAAAEQLERKLKAQHKDTPKKVDYRAGFGPGGKR